MSWHLQCTVNGSSQDREVPHDVTLLTLLREHLGQTGSNGASLEGECGSCTVLLDGEPVCSCLVLAAQAHGREVITVEGLAKDGRLSDLQERFIETGAAQCGYCTPGLLMAARALLDGKPRPTDDEIHTALEGNICRCTGYSSIVESVHLAAGGERP